MGWMEDKDLRVQQEEMEQKANQVHRDHPELKERLEKLDLQEAWVQLELRVSPVHRVLEEGLEKLEQKDHQVQLVLVDLQERMEIWEWEAQQVQPAWLGSPGEQGLTGAPGPRGLQGPKGVGVYHPPPPPPPIHAHAPLPSYQPLPPPPPPAQFQNSPQFSVPQSAFFPNKKREAPFTNPSTLQQSQFSTNTVRVKKGNKGGQKRENHTYYKGAQKRDNQKKWAKKVNKGQENQRGKGWNTVTSSKQDSREDDWEPSHTKNFNKGSTFGSNSGFNQGSSFSKIVRGPDVGNQDFTDSGEPGTFVETFEITTKLSSPNNKNNRNKGNKNNKHGGRRSSRRNHN